MLSSRVGCGDSAKAQGCESTLWFCSHNFSVWVSLKTLWESRKCMCLLGWACGCMPFARCVQLTAGNAMLPCACAVTGSYNSLHSCSTMRCCSSVVNHYASTTDTAAKCRTHCVICCSAVVTTALWIVWCVALERSIWPLATPGTGFLW